VTVRDGAWLTIVTPRRTGSRFNVGDPRSAIHGIALALDRKANPVFGKKEFVRTALVGACFLSLCGGAPRAQTLFDHFNLGYDGSDAPGGPRSPAAMSRRLLEDGYVLRAPLAQVGPVYFANVVQENQQLCLVLDVFTGTILQTFAFTPRGLRALNSDAPGPGYPGYPPAPDGRYAHACYPTAAAVAPAPAPPAWTPPPIPKIAPGRPAPHRLRIRRKRRASCELDQAPAPMRAPDLLPPPSTADKSSVRAGDPIHESEICEKPTG
jgi:hypothetical protein